MNLATTQLLSLATKAITTALGVVQSIIVIRLLGPTGWGLVGLVMSIGGIIGVTQHLGVVDGAIREIAIRRRKDEIGKVFWVSNLVRQVVTIPLSIALIGLAGTIAVGLYGKPEIIPFIQIFAASLILQGLQDVFGATLTGMKRFVPLYVIQIVTAALNIVIFGYLTWLYGIAGFFWAVIMTTAIMVTLFGFVLAVELKGYLRWPGLTDIRRYARSVMRVGAYMYVARIFFVLWQRLPLLVLGGVLSADELGYFNVSLTFGSKLTIIAMALSEVNLAWMSSLFTEKREEFNRIVVRNMQRVFVLMLGITLVLLFFTPEIIHYAIGAEFEPAQPLILIMTSAFFLYALLDLGTSSIFVAADRPQVRAGIFGLMMGLTGVVVVGVLLSRPSPLWAAVGVFCGALVGYLMLLLVARRKLNIIFLTRPLAWLLLVLAGSVAWLFFAPTLPARIIVFLVMSAYVGYEVWRGQLIPTINHVLPNARYRIICFAGAFYDAPTWTNRQHIMSRISEQYPVLYVEPRIWIVRYIYEHWREPAKIGRFLQRIIWWEVAQENLWVKAQWNLIPGSREYDWIGRFNHWLNRRNIRFTARLLGFDSAEAPDHSAVVWLYDTEAAEYLQVWPKATVVYDCVDDHAVQAGPNRNSQRVRAEEAAILRQAHLVTVTSRHLYDQKRPLNPNTHLVEQAADVMAFLNHPGPAMAGPPLLVEGGQPSIGSVGALDSYKYDFDLIGEVARANPHWQFIFIGEPVVDRRNEALSRVEALPNVRLVGAVPRAEVPAYVAQFDVCIIPYRASDYNRSSFPLKFWEFMGSGKPIVVSGLPELARYRLLVGYADTASDFTAALEQALAAPTAGQAERLNLAQGHSWEKRVERLLNLLYSTV